MAAATFSQTFFAPGGGVAASCKAYTYVRGTTTPLAAYTDVGLTTPATNPVIGSGVGVLLFYLDGVEDYSLTIKTSDDATTLMQVDYVAAGGFFSIISYTIENVQFAEFPFTGDGAETEYTLSNVLAPSVHSLWIALDGVYQPVSTYSVTRDSTDTHVTFGTAPANNADITIRLMALQGQRGDDGDSAYQIAVNNGFVGTEPEWLETLIGTSSRDEQVFSGDGSDLTFVFTGMVITDKLNISIFVDGIIQRESDYSLSNNGTDTTITFGTAPPLGTNNIVMRGAVLTGSGGAAVDSVNGQTGVVVLDADDIDDTSTTQKFTTAAEISKLAGIASGATVYTDEMARDALGTALTAGTGVTITPNDGSDIITIAIDTTAEAERTRDVIGTALVAGSNITLTVNDGSDTITIAATGGGGSAASVTFDPTGLTYALATNVQDAMEQLDAAIGGGGYTDEMAQDAAAALFTPDDGDIDFTYNDGTPSLTAQIKAGAVDTAELATGVKPGVLTFGVPAAAMTPATTNGAAAGTTESTTNKVMYNTLDFDASTQEYAHFDWESPKGWDLGTFTAEFVWLGPSGTGNVIWGIQAVAISDDDLLDAAFGTAQEVTDGVTATTDKMKSAATSAVTIAGTPAALDTIKFRVYRKAADGSDTLASDAKLLAVRITVTFTAHNDA